MGNFKYSLSNRILALFLAICMITMACFPYNISYANTDESVNESNTEEVIEETENEEIEHDWIDATCTEAKTCSICGETDGEALGHDWIDATCTKAKTCSECGETDGEALGHDWEDATCTKAKTCSQCDKTDGEELGHDWIDATCTEAKTCSICGEKNGEELGHDWIDATCTRAKTCSVCGETDGEELGHDWILTVDGISKICNVCEKTEVVEIEHDWVDATCTRAKTCSECGETEGEALGHDWVEATCTKAKICSVCGETEGEALGHDWCEATCTKAKTCSVCGEIEGEELGHDWRDATCTEAKTCSVCGETDGEALGHDWVLTVDGISKICNICEKTEVVEIEHDWEAATCTKAKTCSECGETDGEALGHDWIDATCTKAKTCSVCGEIEGEELGHDWEDATCTKAKTCSICGETEGDALGHDWVVSSDGISKTCNICKETTQNENNKEIITPNKGFENIKLNSSLGNISSTNSINLLGSNQTQTLSTEGETEEYLPANPTIDPASIVISVFDKNGKPKTRLNPTDILYVTTEDSINVTLTGYSLVLESLSVKFGRDPTLNNGITINENGKEDEYIIKKTFKDTDSAFEGDIQFYIYQGDTLLPYNIPTYCIFDMTPPEFTSISAVTYGSKIGSNEAYVNILVNDYNGVKHVERKKDSGNWEIVEPIGDRYMFYEMGEYKFRAVDIVSNISAESDTVTIYKGEKQGTIPKVEIAKYPKLEYVVRDENTLEEGTLFEGGMLKVGYTFDVCGCQTCIDNGECTCEMICLCEDDCNCTTGTCSPDNGCNNCELACLLYPMTKIDDEGKLVLNDGITAKYPSNILQETGDKTIEITYLGYTETFEIKVSLAENDYILEIDVPSGVTTPIKAIVTTDLTNAEYTWSSSPDDAGKEIYRAGLKDDPPAKEEGSDTEPVSDKVDDVCDKFKYEFADTLPWTLDNNTFTAHKLPFKDSKKRSVSKIIINTGDVGGEISFKWQTHTLASHIFSVKIDEDRDGDTEIVLIGSGNDKNDVWQTFTYDFGVNYFDEDDTKDFVIELCYEVDGVRLPSTNDVPVIIKDLVFKGEKIWYPLGEVDSNMQVEVELDTSLGPNNYLHIRDTSISDKTLKVSDNCEGKVTIEGIDIINPPSSTLYTVDTTNTTESVDLSDGYIRIIYSSGEKEVYMEDVSGISVEVDNDGSGSFSSNKIDVSKPGVRKVKISYAGYDAYFPVIVVDEDTINSEANAPVLRPGMIPVVWSKPDSNEEGYWVATTKEDSGWYNYSDKIWANVMLRDDITISGVDSDEDKESKIAGKKIIDEGSMFVWVPRFAYKVARQGVVNVIWINGTGDSPDSNYTVHPAFTYNGQQLPGFWMAKFEASEGLNVDVASKSNTQPYYTGVSLQNAYDYSINMVNITDNSMPYNSAYGVDFSGTVTHLTKPDEWGAVALLAYSSYGSIPYNNNFIDGYDDKNIYISRTGYSPKSADSAEAKEGSTNEPILISESDAGSTASTTGNAYGIFDMSGGVKEYVAAYVKYSPTYLATSAAQYTGTLGYPGYDETKFNSSDIDVIDLSASNITSATTASQQIFTAVKAKKGWAMFELTGVTSYTTKEVWKNKGADGIKYSNKFNDTFLRGGDVDEAKKAGVLATNINSAAGDVTRAGFRPTILITNSSAEAPITFNSVTIASYPPDSANTDRVHNPFYAKAGDKVVITVNTSTAAKITNAVLTAGDGTNLEPVIISDGDKVSTITYIVPYDKNISGEVSFEFDIVSPKGTFVEHVVHQAGVENGESDIKDGSSVTIDTIANEVTVSTEDKDSEREQTFDISTSYTGNETDVKIYITDLEGNPITGLDGQTDPTDGNKVNISIETVDDGNGGVINNVTGSITISEPGDYIVTIIDAAGNESTHKLGVSEGVEPEDPGEEPGEDPGEDPGEGSTPGSSVNPSTNLPELLDLSIFVEIDGEFIEISELPEDRYYILRDDKVKFVMNFDKKLTTGPRIYFGNGTSIAAVRDTTDLTVWTAEAIMDDLRAYTNFTFRITGYKYGSNGNVDITAHKYDAIPYDGSNVNVVFTDLEIWQEIDSIWTKVDKIENENLKLPTNLIYTVVFSDVPVGSDGTIDYFDTDYGIKLNVLNDDIILPAGFTVESIDIEEVSNIARKITFNNVSGKGKFSFGIRGATASNPIVIDPVAQDIYGHPNNQTDAVGMYGVQFGQTGGGGDSDITEYIIILHHNNDGKSGPTIQKKPTGVDINLTTEIPPIPPNEGDRFKGWSLSEEAKIVDYEPGDLFTEDANTELWAVWESGVKLTVISGDITSSSIEEPDTTINLEAAIRNGYVFVGWDAVGITLTDEQVVSSTIDFIMPNNDVVLEVIYAKLGEEIYIISYDANGGENAPIAQVKMENVDITLRTEIPTWDGHTFQGWAKPEDPNTVVYDPGASFTENSDMTLYAVWELNTYTVTYVPNPEEGVENMPSDHTKTHGVDLQLSDLIPTRDGHTFQGWKDEDTGIVYQPGATFAENKDTILTTIWSLNEYTVTYEPNADGAIVENMPSDQTKTHGVDLQLSNMKPTREGHEFQGWAREEDKETVVYARGDLYTIDADITLYAVWNKNEYTITYDKNTIPEEAIVENMPSDQTKPHGEDITLSTKVPTREDYTFVAWSTNAEGTGAIYSPGATFTVNADTTLYAIWQVVIDKVNVYVETINSRAYGEETVGKIITVSANTVPGCAFTSWTATGITLTPEQQASSTITFVVPANDVTLTANYLKGYTITYNANGGVGVPENQVKIKDVDLTLSSTTPTKDGYLFKEWNTESDGSGNVYSAGGTFALNSNVTLYAIWQDVHPVLADKDNWYKGSVAKANITKITFMDSFDASGETGITETWSASIGDEVATGYLFSDNTVVVSGDGSSKIYANSNSQGMFGEFTALTEISGLELLDTSNVTSMSHMFYNSSNLVTADVSGFDTSRVTNMNRMFNGCSKLAEIDVSNFDTSKVIDMERMFHNCASVVDLDVSNFDTSNVSNFGQMFQNCSKVTEIDVSNFNTSKATDMNRMFYSCSSVSEIDVSDFDTSKVTDMTLMFYDCRGVGTLDVSNFNTSQVTNMKGMFRKCTSMTELDISSFDTSNVTDMSQMFYQCSNSEFTIYVADETQKNLVEATSDFPGTATVVIKAT